MNTPLSDWLSPAQFAEELTRDGQPVTAAWVRANMAAGIIPCVQIGKRRWFTPACREEMERRAVIRTEQPTPTRDPAGFGAVFREKRRAS